MFYRKASSFIHPKILLHSEQTTPRACDSDSVWLPFTWKHHENMIFFTTSVSFLTKIMTLKTSHNWYHIGNWQNKLFHLIIKTWKYFFLLRNGDRPPKLFSNQDISPVYSQNIFHTCFSSFNVLSAPHDKKRITIHLTHSLACCFENNSS